MTENLCRFNRDPNKMDDKMGKCMPDLCCVDPQQRQLMESLGMMQPLSIKTEQAKRACNACLTNSPKKVPTNSSYRSQQDSQISREHEKIFCEARSFRHSGVVVSWFKLVSRY